MKLTVTIGIDAKNKPLIVAGPDGDVDGQIANLRTITNNGGKIGTGKTAVKLAEAVIVHTSKGTLKRRKF